MLLCFLLSGRVAQEERAEERMGEREIARERFSEQMPERGLGWVGEATTGSRQDRIGWHDGAEED